MYQPCLPAAFIKFSVLVIQMLNEPFDLFTTFKLSLKFYSNGMMIALAK